MNSIEAMKQALERIADPRNIHFSEDARVVAQEALAIAEAEKQCTHRLVDVTNPVVKSGYMCMDCGAVFRSYTEKPQRQPLTEREVELIDGMIEVQLQHAMQCDRIANRTMADKQKGWDMERVELLQKLKAAHGIKGEA